MKAITITKYGPPDILKLQEVEKPAVRENEVLVKIYAASLNPLDWHMMRGEPFLVRFMVGGLLNPKNQILGADIAGRVEAVGKKVTKFQPGDEVFGGNGLRGFAEYACLRENNLAIKPANLSFEEAAAIPIAGLTALQALRDNGQIRPGQKVLINGAGGGVGTFAVQIAKSFGAEVTGVCSTEKLNKVQSIGADQVIDYTQEDFTQNGQAYDLILDAAAYRSVSDYKRALAPRGIYVLVGGSMSLMLQLMLLRPWLSISGKKKMGSMLAKIIRKDLLIIRELLETGKVIPVIDRHYPLSEVPEAIRYLEKGHARGKIVITVQNSIKT